MHLHYLYTLYYFGFSGRDLEEDFEEVGEEIEDFGAVLDEVEDVMDSLVDAFWGKKCFLDVQCSHIFLETTLVQVSACATGRGYTGTERADLQFVMD